MHWEGKVTNIFTVNISNIYNTEINTVRAHLFKTRELILVSL